MNRIDRLHAILTTLQSKRVVKAEELATRFNISIRTVYRDLRALEEGGVPLGAEAGVGYYLTEGYHLPPIMFTHQEARALLLAGKLLEKNSDKNIRENFNHALTKVKAVLDMEKKDDLESLEQKIIVNPFPSARPDSDNLNLEEIKQALSANKVLSLEYSSLKEKTVREVEPVGLCFYGNKWHLIAYCRMRKDYRDFRLDRIQHLHRQPESFLRAKHPGLKEYLDKMMSETDMLHVTIRVHKDTLPYIQESKYSMGWIGEKLQGDWTEMTFATYSCDYFCRWMLMLGKNAEVVEPEALRQSAENLIRELWEKYKK